MKISFNSPNGDCVFFKTGEDFIKVIEILTNNADLIERLLDDGNELCIKEGD